MQDLNCAVECFFSNSFDTIDKHYTAHPKYEMFFLMDGDVTMLINSQRYRVSNGALILLTSKDLHLSINNLSRQKYKRITVMFDPKVIQTFNTSHTNLLSCFAKAASTQRNILYLNEAQQMEYVRHAEKIVAHWGSEQYGDDLTTISALISLLIMINNLYRTHCSNPAPLSCSPVIMELVKYIDSHLSEELTVKSLCDRFSYSEPYVSTLFSKQMGLSLKRFILTKKLALAKQLLQESVSVMQVCEQCGFSDYSNFIRAFKKQEGMPPRRWKQAQETIR